jgi:hypothetical protein
MRDQYAGDVSDAIKFALLRALAGADRKLGVAWYYVPGHDGSSDGKHLDWRTEPAWNRLDPGLHAELSRLPERSVVALEHLAIWPRGTVFHREPMPPAHLRGSWCASKRAALQGADLIFLDPDKGVGKASESHATFDEVRSLKAPGRAVVFIVFPGRIPHDLLVQQLHDRLRAEAGATRCLTVRTSISVPSAAGYVPSLRWFTVVDPDAALITRAYSFADALR